MVKRKFNKTNDIIMIKISEAYARMYGGDANYKITLRDMNIMG